RRRRACRSRPRAGCARGGAARSRRRARGSPASASAPSLSPPRREARARAVDETALACDGTGVLRTVLLRLALAFGGLAVTLVGIEVAVRIVTAFDRNVLDELLSPRPCPPDRKLTLVHLVRPNADDRIVYELRP